VLLTTGPELRAPIAELTHQAVLKSTSQTLADADRAHIIATLRETNWVVGGPNGAAVRLGLKRTTLIKKMQVLEIFKETPKRNNGPSTCYRDRTSAEMTFAAAG
jgi:transcriptional regulator with GAF, ATPase, and Fis domain